MPIPFSCECGKKLQAKDEFAGKKMRCPSCGKLLTIPAPPAPEPLLPPAAAHVAEVPAPPPAEEGGPASTPAVTPPPEPGVVRFVCSCGRRIKARSEGAGETVDCPDGGRTLTVPAKDTDEPPLDGRAAAAMAQALGQTVTPWRDAEARRRGADGPTPRDEKVGGGFGKVLVVLLVAAALAAPWVFSRQIKAAADEASARHAPPEQAPPHPLSELDRIPADAPAFLVVRPAALAREKRGEAGRAAAKQYAELALRGHAARLLRVIRGAEIERATVVVLAPRAYRGGRPRRDSWTVVRSTYPIDREAVLRALLPAVKRKTQDVQVYYKAADPNALPGPSAELPRLGRRPGEEGDKQKQPKAPPPPPSPGVIDLAVHFPNRYVVVIADNASMKRFLARQPAPVVRGPLAGPLGEARQGHTLVVGLNATRHTLDPAAPRLPPEVLDFRSGQLALDGPDPVRADLRLTYADGRAGKAAAAIERKRGEDAADIAKDRQTLKWDRLERVGLPAVQAVAALPLAASPRPRPPLEALACLSAVREEARWADIERDLARREAFAAKSRRLERAGATLRLTVDARAADADLALPAWAPFVELVFAAVPAERPQREGAMRVPLPGQPKDR